MHLIQRIAPTLETEAKTWRGNDRSIRHCARTVFTLLTTLLLGLVAQGVAIEVMFSALAILGADGADPLGGEEEARDVAPRLLRLRISSHRSHTVVPDDSPTRNILQRHSTPPLPPAVLVTPGCQGAGIRILC